MNAQLDEEKRKLERQKEKLRLKENIIREKEKRKRARFFHEIGKLAYRTKIDTLNEEILLGAFVEIRDNQENEETVSRWKHLAYNFISNETNDKEVAVCVTFKNDPSKETRDIMKKNKFRWNSFRKEFYGYGSKELLERELEGVEFTLEVVV